MNGGGHLLKLQPAGHEPGGASRYCLAAKIGYARLVGPAGLSCAPVQRVFVARLCCQLGFHGTREGLVHAVGHPKVELTSFIGRPCLVDLPSSG